MIQLSLVLALASGGSAVTIAKSRIFAPLRWAIAGRSEWAHALVACPYCLVHWIVFGLVAIYQPRLVRSDLPVLDVTVTAFAIIAASGAFTALLSRLYWPRG